MKLFKRVLSFLLSFSLLCASISQTQAAIISNDEVIRQIQYTIDKTSLMQSVHREDVQKQLLDLGVNTTDLEARINNMTHEELAQLNQKINELPAGGDVLGLLVLIFLVFVVTDVIGATDIFPFIHPVK